MKRPKINQEVCWESPFDGWRFGEYLGVAPGGRDFAKVRTLNGVVHVRFDVLCFKGQEQPQRGVWTE